MSQLCFCGTHQRPSTRRGPWPRERWREKVCVMSKRVHPATACGAAEAKKSLLNLNIHKNANTASVVAVMLLLDAPVPPHNPDWLSHQYEEYVLALLSGVCREKLKERTIRGNFGTQQYYPTLGLHGGGRAWKAVLFMSRPLLSLVCGRGRRSWG